MLFSNQIIFEYFLLRSFILVSRHIYSNSLDVAEEILSRKTNPFPTLNVVNQHDNIFDYRCDDFELKDYHPQAKIKNIKKGV